MAHCGGASAGSPLKHVVFSLIFFSPVLFANELVLSDWRPIPDTMVNAALRISAERHEGQVVITGHGTAFGINLAAYGFNEPRYMLTACHVAREMHGHHTLELKVELRDSGRVIWVPCQIVSYDESIDLCLLKSESDLPVLTDLSEEECPIGAPLVLVGSPRAIPIAPYRGSLVQKAFDDSGHWEAQVQFDHGDSGGPVFDAVSGRVLGVAVAGVGRGGDEMIPNIGLFVPYMGVRRFLDSKLPARQGGALALAHAAPPAPSAVIATAPAVASTPVAKPNPIVIPEVRPEAPARVAVSRELPLRGTMSEPVASLLPKVKPAPKVEQKVIAPDTRDGDFLAPAPKEVASAQPKSVLAPKTISAPIAEILPEVAVAPAAKPESIPPKRSEKKLPPAVADMRDGDFLPVKKAAPVAQKKPQPAAAPIARNAELARAEPVKKLESKKSEEVAKTTESAKKPADTLKQNAKSAVASSKETAKPHAEKQEQAAVFTTGAFLP